MTGPPWLAHLGLDGIWKQADGAVQRDARRQAVEVVQGVAYAGDGHRNANGEGRHPQKALA